MTITKNNKKALIIGGGISGLTAARTLIDNGFDKNNVKVLEARNRIGGRINTIVNDDNTTYSGSNDMGASWIHDSSANNPISKIQSLINLEVISTDDSNVSIWQKCTNDGEGDCDELDDDLYNLCLEKITNVPKVPGKSLKDAFDIDTRARLATDSIQFQYFLTTSTEFQYGASIDQLDSARYEPVSASTTNSENIFKNGYKGVIDTLYNGTIRLYKGTDAFWNKYELTKTDPNEWNSIIPPITKNSGVLEQLKVEKEKNVTKIEYNNQDVTVTMDNGDVERADYVIVTVPLGVLKKNKITFQPALPSEITQAINGLGFGNVNKFSFRFNSAFWAGIPTDDDDTDEDRIWYDKRANEHYYGLAGVNKEERNMYTYFMNMHKLTDEPVLMTFAVGNGADISETHTDEEVWAKTRANLINIFGKSVVPESYEELRRSKWREDEFAYGTYTYEKLNPNCIDYFSAFTSRYIIGDKNIFFAGEHTLSEFMGTVHGAFWSGFLAASQVFDKIDDKENLNPIVNNYNCNANFYITGIDVIGKTLTATRIFEDPKGMNTISYKWQHSVDKNNWQDISQADNKTYVVSNSDNKKYIRCIISYNDNNSKQKSVTTNPTNPISKSINIENFTDELTRENVEDYINDIIADPDVKEYARCVLDNIY